MQEITQEFTLFLDYLVSVAEYLGEAMTKISSAFSFLPVSISAALISLLSIVIIFRVVK